MGGGLLSAIQVVVDAGSAVVIVVFDGVESFVCFFSLFCTSLSS